MTKTMTCTVSKPFDTCIISINATISYVEDYYAKPDGTILILGTVMSSHCTDLRIIEAIE